MTDEQVDAKIANIKAVNYIRIGEEMKAEIAALYIAETKKILKCN